MKVICISGKARHGKDTAASFMIDTLQRKGKKVLLFHYADLVKYVCKNMFGWDGNKDEKGRSILQYVGTDVVRKQRPDYWVDFLVDILKLFPNEWDYVVVPDTRFPNEVDKLKAEGFDVTYIRVVRPNFDSGLTKEQLMHESEIALDNYKPDFEFRNCGTMADLQKDIDIWVGNNV